MPDRLQLEIRTLQSSEVTMKTVNRETSTDFKLTENDSSLGAHTHEKYITVYRII